MWNAKEFNLGYENYSAVIAWLNEVGAVDADFVMRQPGVLLVFARYSTIVPRAQREPVAKLVAKKGKKAT
jgi:hypothetical protein